MTKVKPALLALCIGFFGLAACSGLGSQPLPFRAPPVKEPTLIAIHPQPTPSPLPVQATQAAPTPACTDSLSFLGDLTLPDGSQVKPGERLDKRWSIHNSGTCNWDASYRLKLVSGSALGGNSQQTLYPARGGTDALVRMVFSAPDQPGQYRSAWQAYNAKDEAFGDPFFIEIVVEQP